MTEYFEVHERDGAARLGELRLESPRTTPALVDDLVDDAGSLWSADRAIPDGNPGRLTVLPHRGFPGGTAAEVQESFIVDHPDVDFPSVGVISSESDGSHTVTDGPDAYALSNVQSVLGHGSRFVEAVITARESIPADTALYCAGVATPRNVSILVYAGIDLFDATAAIIAGTRGQYLTTDGASSLDDLEELPCICPACANGATTRSVEDFDREDCIEHNKYVLESELATVRQRIRANRLREYVEGQARHDQWLTAVMRTLDDQWSYLEERTPILRNATLDATTEDAMRRVEVRRYADRVTSRYRNRFANPLVLVPCSARKPYSESKSHSRFHEAIQWRGHVVTLTSPLGVVPQELETTYPAQQYDTVVTGRWSADEVAFVAEVLERYLERNADTYDRIVAHVPADGYREVVEQTADSLASSETVGDLVDEITYTVDGHPTDESSIDNLRVALDGQLKYAKREREHNTVRAIADYVLGDGAGDSLFESIRTTSRYPRLQIWNRNDEQLATMVPQYGTLSFTLEGAKRWVESDVPVKRVEIDDFVPHGSVLAPGVVDADEAIRVGDEVVVEGPSAFGIGRAEMFGREMEESTRGIACEIRHVEER